MCPAWMRDIRSMAKQTSLTVPGAISTKSTFTPGKIDPREAAIASNQYSLWTLLNALIAARTFIRELVGGDQPGGSQF